MADDELKRRPVPYSGVRGHALRRYDLPAPVKRFEQEGRRRGGVPPTRYGYRCECGRKDYGATGSEHAARVPHRAHLADVWGRMEDERIRKVRQDRARRR